MRHEIKKTKDPNKDFFSSRGVQKERAYFLPKRPASGSAMASIIAEVTIYDLGNPSIIKRNAKAKDFN